MRRDVGRGGTGWVAIAAAVVTVVGASVLGSMSGTSADGTARGHLDERARATASPTSPARRNSPQPVSGQASVPDPGLPAPVVSMDISHASDKGLRAVNITIDDGPDPVWTPRVLDVLRHNGVKAVFCMIGTRAAEYPAVVRQVVADGHRLCDHSVHHDTAMDHKSRSFQRSEVVGAAQMIEQASGGVKPLHYRAPGGAFTPYSRQIAASMGMRPLGWNVDTDDYKRPGTRAILNDRLIAAGLADQQANPVDRRENLLRLTDEGRRTVEEVTARRRAEIAAVVERLRPMERLALVEALNAFNEAGGEPPVPGVDDPGPHRLGRVMDGTMAHDA